MRSENETPSICEETDVKVICAVEEAAEEYKDCPAACRKDNTKEEEDNNSDEVVKAGDLDVTTSGESNGKFFIGRASDLDTITLKTSEEVTISRIILEREGYTTRDNVVSVWLEDENGAKIAEGKSLDSKGQVKLTLKKDYKVVDGELNATIVVETSDGTTGTKPAAGSTIGFKVVDVESTAKNTNISGKANTYTGIDYDGSKMTLVVKANAAKEYNWSAENLYEVAKFKVNTPDDSSIILRGFTFTNGGNLDLRKYFDKAEVTIAGEKVSGLEANVNKNDELVISFKDYEVAAKTKAEVVVKIALTEDFDQFPATVILSLSDYVAVDGKVESRVDALDGTSAANPLPKYTTTALTSYTFRGGKIKLSNTKLGNIDAPQDSEGIVVAEGSITIPEAVKAKTFTITANGDGATFIKQMTFVVNGEETDANSSCAAVAATPATTDSCTFTFTNVEIEKSGKVQFKIDVRNAPVNKQTVTFTTFNTERFPTTAKAGLIYDESGNDALTEVSGSVSFSKVTLQPAKASMSNSLTKEVEFANKDSQRKVVFEGEYTAKKGDVKLNEFIVHYIATTPADTAIAANLNTANQYSNKVTFYVYVDDMEESVADAKLVYDSTATAGNTLKAADTFDNIEVEAGKTVKVKVEAEVEANNSDSDATTPLTAGVYPINLGKYEFILKGEDSNGNSNSGEGKANTVQLKVVEKGSVKVTDSSDNVKQTILKRAADSEIASFIVKPSNGSSETDLEEISFALVDDATAAVITSADDITIKVNKIPADDCSLNTAAVTIGSTSYPINSIVTCPLNEKVSSDGLPVVISLDNETTGIVEVKELEINDKAQSKTFTKQFVGATAEIVGVEYENSQTHFKLKIDDEEQVKNFKLYSDTACSSAIATAATASDVVLSANTTLSVTNDASAPQNVNCAEYYYWDDDLATPAWTKVQVKSNKLPDYFKVNDKTVIVEKAKS